LRIQLLINLYEKSFYKNPTSQRNLTESASTLPRPWFWGEHLERENENLAKVRRSKSRGVRPLADWFRAIYTQTEAKIFF